MNIIVNGELYDVLSERSSNPFIVHANKIAGVVPEPDYTPELLEKFQNAWASVLAGMNIKRYKVPSKTHPNTFYTVTSFNDHDHICSCPARGRCWHIDYVISQERNQV